MEYDNLTVCSNGWIAPGITENTSFMNWPIPGPLGPSPMIAVFWDDLFTDNSSSIKYMYNLSGHYLAITWENMRNEYDLNYYETFQVILYDANFNSTIFGDSEIKFQYQEFNNVDAGSYPSNHGQYCTVGIEDHTGTRGLEYTYNDVYPVQAKTITDSTALLFVSGPAYYALPYLVIDEVILDDANGNGLADYGESVNLNLVRTNK